MREIPFWLIGLRLPIYLYFMPQRFREVIEVTDSRDKRRFGLLIIALVATVWVLIPPAFTLLVYPSARVNADFSLELITLAAALVFGLKFIHESADNKAQGLAIWMAAIIGGAAFICGSLIGRGIAFDSGLPMAEAVDRQLTAGALEGCIFAAAGIWICFWGVGKSARRAMLYGLLLGMLLAVLALAGVAAKSLSGQNFALAFVVYALVFTHLWLLPVHLITAALGLFAPVFPRFSPFLWRISPANWDEFVFWPVPGLRRLLDTVYREAPLIGQPALARVLNHPYQYRTGRAFIATLGVKRQWPEDVSVARRLYNFGRYTFSGEFSRGGLTPRSALQFAGLFLVGGTGGGLAIFIACRIFPLNTLWFALAGFAVGITAGGLHLRAGKHGGAIAIPIVIAACLLALLVYFTAGYVTYRGDLAADVVRAAGTATISPAEVTAQVDAIIIATTGRPGWDGYIAYTLRTGQLVMVSEFDGIERKSGDILVTFWILDALTIIGSAIIFFFVGRLPKYAAHPA